MDPREKPVYREWSPWPGWITVVFWGAAVLALGSLAREGDEGLLGAVLVALLAGAVHWLIAGLSVRLYRDRLVVGIGSAGLISKRVRYADVVRLESVRYHPLREFGGWGVRFGPDRRRAWTARGDQAVVLHLVDGTVLYVGSDRPHRLEERIRAVAGTRIGSAAAEASD